MTGEQLSEGKLSLRELILAKLSIPTLNPEKVKAIVDLISNDYKMGFLKCNKIDGHYENLKFFSRAVHRAALLHYCHKIDQIDGSGDSDEEKTHQMIKQTLGFFAYLIEEKSQELAEKFYPLIRFTEAGDIDELGKRVSHHYRMHEEKIPTSEAAYFGQTQLECVYFPVVPQSYAIFDGDNAELQTELANIRDQYLPFSPSKARQSLVHRDTRILGLGPGSDRHYFPAYPQHKADKATITRCLHFEQYANNTSIKRGLTAKWGERINAYLPFHQPPEGAAVIPLTSLVS